MLSPAITHAEHGALLCGRYRLERSLGKGIQGETYLAFDVATDELRAVKVFAGSASEGARAARWQHRKYERLRNVRQLPKCHGVHTAPIDGRHRGVLVMEYIEGVALEDIVRARPERRLEPLLAMQLTYALARAVETIHAERDYHGDIHLENVLVVPRGPTVDIRLLDFYPRTGGLASKQRQDVDDVVAFLYRCVGGKAGYSHAPDYVRAVCFGMQRHRIAERFPFASNLRRHLERFPW